MADVDLRQTDGSAPDDGTLNLQGSSTPAAGSAGGSGVLDVSQPGSTQGSTGTAAVPAPTTLVLGTADTLATPAGTLVLGGDAAPGAAAPVSMPTPAAGTPIAITSAGAPLADTADAAAATATDPSTTLTSITDTDADPEDQQSQLDEPLFRFSAPAPAFAAPADAVPVRTAPADEPLPNPTPDTVAVAANIAPTTSSTADASAMPFTRPIDNEEPTDAATTQQTLASAPSAPANGLLPDDQPKTFFAKLKYLWNHQVKGKPGMQQQQAAASADTVAPTGKPLDALVDKPADQLTDSQKRELRDAEALFEQGVATLVDVMAPAAIRFDPAKMMIDGQYAQTFFVYDYPHFLESAWLSSIINAQASMDISMFLYPRDSAEIMSFLRRKVTQLGAEMNIYRSKGLTRDPYIEAKYKDAEELRDALARGQERFFSCSLYFTVYAESEDKLKLVAKKLQNELGGKLVLSKPAFLQMERGYNSTLPQATDELALPRSLNTSPLSSTFPFVSSTLTSDDGILYGINRHNNSLIIFDRFQLPNANSVVLATSGAGKSFAVKLEILRSLMWGTDVIVIDPENEYQDLCRTVGGTYLRLSLTSGQRINPFDLPRPIAGQDDDDGGLLRSNIISLHGLLAIMLGGLTPQEQSLLDKALIQTYALKGITFDTPDPHSYLPPVMADLKAVLESMNGGADLALRLDPYVTGAYSGFFGGQTNVQLDQGMMVFCVRDLEEQLRPMAMYIVLGYIWNRVRSELRKRLLVIDEAWNIMRHEDSGSFLFGLVKRARKYYLGITTISQDVEDFVNSPYGKPIVTNSSMVLLLKQSPTAVDMLEKIFHLTAGEKQLLTTSGVGQGIFFAGDKHVATQIVASYTEEQLVTTNPEQILARQQQATQE